MDKIDLRTLRFLEEIDNNHMSSQRDLARHLNVSLGLVNSFVKRLAHKGYFKITTIPRNRVRYMLTPKGAAEKARLTYEYIQYSVQYYKKARQNLRDLFISLESQGVRRIVFYGVSDLAEIAYISLQETRIRMVAICDDDQTKEKFLGFPVEPIQNIKKIALDRILVTAMKPNDVMLQKILEKGIQRAKIILLE